MPSLASLALVALVATACLPRPRPAVVPLATIPFAGSPEARCLVVFLPGIGDKVEDFVSNGFIDRLRERGSRCDALIVDSHFAYFQDGSIVRRLHDDVIEPARERGVESIWLVGISLGGLGAGLYARDQPHELAGIALIAPFLGDEKILDEIERAGGPRAWHPPGEFEEKDLRRLWIWLEHATDPSDPAADHPEILLAAGERDRFRRGHRLLAELLPRERVATVRGGHNWAAWRRAWDRLLAMERIGRPRGAVSAAVTGGDHGASPSGGAIR